MLHKINYKELNEIPQIEEKSIGNYSIHSCDRGLSILA